MRLDAKSITLLQNLGKRSEKEIFEAAKKAGISGARRMRTEASRQVRARKPIRVKDANKRITVLTVFASRLEDLGWRVRVDGSPLPVGSFRPSQTGKGVRFTANKGARSTLPGAFLATMPNGHKGAFTRKRGAKHKEKQVGSRLVRTQLPIQEMYTSGMASVFKDQSAADAVQNAGEREFTVTFSRLIRVRL